MNNKTTASSAPVSLLKLVAFLACLGIVLWSCLNIAADPPANAPPGAPAALVHSRRALLIGCGVYPNLPQVLQLKGPANDVALLRKVLTEKMKLADEQIITLHDDAAADFLPTRANIEREFLRLAETAKPGEEIYIHLSGHGTQQPDSEDDDQDPEPDGLDEVFCTRDIKRVTTGDSPTIPGVITDDELNRWCRKIREQGASIWIVADTCHSGTIVRGDEQQRAIPPRMLLPEKVLAKLQQRGDVKTQAPTAKEVRTDSKIPLGGIAALYASQANEPTVEKKLPKVGADKKPYGLLTYLLVSNLMQAKEPLSLRQLAERIAAEYKTDGREKPNPWVEGDATDRPFLGSDSLRNTARGFNVSATSTGLLRLEAGSLHGLTPGSLLAIHAEGQDPTQAPAIGYVRLDEVQPWESTAVKCEHLKMSRDFKLPDQARATLVELAVATTPLKLAITPAARKWFGKDADSFQSVVSPAQDLETADWLLDCDEAHCFLRATSSGRIVAQHAFADEPTKAARVFRQRLSMLVRTQRLLDLCQTAEKSSAETSFPVKATSAKPPNEAESPAEQSACHVKLLKFADEADRQGTPYVAASKPLRDGDFVAFEITNPGELPLDVTLLGIDADGVLQALYPAPETPGDARLPAGKTLRTPRSVVEAKLAGVEHVLVLAIAAEGAPTTFGWVAEEIPVAAPPTVRGGDVRALRSTLGGDLLNLFQNKNTRGWNMNPNRSFQVLKISYAVEPSTEMP